MDIEQRDEFDRLMREQAAGSGTDAEMVQRRAFALTYGEQ